MNSARTGRMLPGVALFVAPVIALLIASAGTIGPAAAQPQAREAPARAEPAPPPKDFRQRALEIYEFKKAAQSGPARGQEVYYYKCWMCHNEFAQSGGPNLVGLFKRTNLVSGEAVTDEAVRNQIRNGSANMPGYGHVLTEADLDDVIAWLKDEQCCWDNAAPPANPRYKATSAASGASPLYASLTGGPRGRVKNARGEPIEGVMVQLIANKTAIRTTVFSHNDGHYEFPKVQPGAYTLRIARPREFYPWSKENIEIKGTDALEDITLLRIVPGELLPPFPEIAAQLTGSEWLQNLPGTAEEKRRLQISCNHCHGYQQIFRNRYDEQGWSKILFRMVHGAGSPLIKVRSPGRISDADSAKFAHWLASIRGPDAQDPNFVLQPRPQGRQLNVVLTEYELPRLEIATHDVTGDAERHVWYSTHRSSYVGRLDPNTGHIDEFHVPKAAGVLPGTHWIYVDPKGEVWGSENWAHNIWTLNPKTQDFRRVHWNVQEPVNSPMGGNYALDEEDNIWRCREGEVARISGTDGHRMEQIKLKKFASTYGSALSWDFRYFGGGAWPKDGVVIYDRKTGEVIEADTSSNSGPARGEFDAEGNFWAAGRGGSLVKFDMKEKRVHEYPLPTPYTSLYTAKADKNGEVWTGELNGGHYLRFNPKTEQFTVYVLPEPYGMDRESWIDNSTDPVSVWYVDHEGWLTHIEPLD